MKIKHFLFLVICFGILCNCFHHKSWMVFSSANTAIKSNYIRRILLTNGQLAWVGTYNGGLYRITNGAWKQVTAPFTGNHVYSLSYDIRGGLWVGTADKGAYYFRDAEWQHIDTSNGLKGQNVWDIISESDTSVWIAMLDGGACLWQDGVKKCLAYADGLTDCQLTVAHKDRTGRLWVGSVSSGAFGIKGRDVQHINAENGLSGNYVRALICDSIVRWVGSWDGGLDHFVNNVWQHIPAVQPPVVFLDFDPEGKLWVGTWGHGVYIQNDDRTFRNIHSGNSGLPNDQVIDIKFDGKGKAYLATSGGLAVWQVNDEEGQ